MPERTYRTETVQRRKFPSPLFWSATTIAALFVLLPFSTYLNRELVRETIPVDPRPFDHIPDYDPPDDPPVDPDPQDDLPVLEDPPVNIPLYELIAGLLPTGTNGFGPGFLDSIGNLLPAENDLIFQREELDRTPRLLRQGRLEYPHELQRNRVEGYVRLKIIIDEQGRVRVAEILDASHRAFVRAAVQSAEGSLFESPLKDGRPVRAYYILPIQFSLRR